MRMDGPVVAFHVIAGIAVGWAFGRLAPAMLRRLGLGRTNYTGQPLVTSGGVLFPLLCLCWLLQPLEPGLRLAAVAGSIFGLLGLIDDRWGSAEFKGLRGHFGAFRRGRITTGWIKAVGGGATACVLGWLLFRDGRAVIAAALIALTANLFNLLDLRPLRTLKAFAVLGMMLVAAAPVPLTSLLGAAIGYAPQEARRKVMLGDAGANALGAVIGTVAASRLPIWVQAAWMLLLAVFHLWAERHSLSVWIEAHPLARRIDRWGWDNFGPSGEQKPGDNDANGDIDAAATDGGR